MYGSYWKTLLLMEYTFVYNETLHKTKHNWMDRATYIVKYA